MKNRVLVVGSVAFDSVENSHGKAERVLGGAASYSSISASYFAAPSIVAVVGTDFTAKDKAPFKKCGVDISGLEVKDGKTFHWGGSYDKDLKNATTHFTDLNVFQDFNPILSEEQKNAISTIRQKILNKEFDLVSEDGKYKIVGYTNDIKNPLETLGFEKDGVNFYIDKELFRETFDNELCRLVDIYNNEYQEVEKQENQIAEEQIPEKEKIMVEIFIVDMNNKNNNRWIELPISRLNFSKLLNEINSNNLKIGQIVSTDADIQNIRSSFTATEEQNELHLNLDGFKQYIRIVTDTKFNGGTAAGADIIGTVVLGNMVSNPVRPTHTDPVDGASIGEAVVGDTLIVK